MAATDDRSVALCRIMLKHELRRLREAKGETASSVAKHFGWSTARMTRMESKDTVVEIGTVRVLCDHYEAPPELREQLESYAKITTSRKDWWDSKRLKGSLPPWFQAYLGLEAAARTIEIYQSEFVPGLLQAPEYAKFILGLSDADDETQTAQAEVRLKRQAVLERPEPPTVTVILNESVIRRPVGSAEVMHQQLSRLLELSAATHLQIQVLPFSAGAHPAMHGPFTLLDFEYESVGEIAYWENLAGGGVLWEDSVVAPFRRAYVQLRGLAAPAEESAQMLRSAIAAL